MTVLVLSHMFPNELDAGNGIFVLEQVKALRKAGVTVIVVSPTPWAPRFLQFFASVRKYSPVTKQATVKGIAVERPRVPTLPKKKGFALSGLLFYLSCRRLVAQIVRQKKVDVIHAHAIMPDGFAAVLLGKEFHLPVVCTAHGSDVNVYPFTSRWVMRATKWALRRVDRLVTVSDKLKRNVDDLVGIRQATVIHNGADPDVFTPLPKSEARKKLGLDPVGEWICFVGYLRSEKALEYLLEGFASLARPSTRLCVVGDGPMKSEWVSQAERLGISASCMFAGARGHEEIPLWLAASDCLVLCSLSEGLPTILPEAMLSRVPVIATDVGGVPEVIRNLDTGLLVPCRDGTAIATALKFLFDSPGVSEELVNRAERFAKASLTWTANAQQMLSVYEDAVRVAMRAQTAIAIPTTIRSSLPKADR